MNYYENDYPVVGEVVFVKIIDITDNTLYCNLIEYSNKSALLQTSEIGRMYKKCTSYFSEKKVYPMLVVGVEDDVVSLSYKKIRDTERDDYVKKIDFFSKIFRLTNEISTMSNLPMDLLMPVTFWRHIKKSDLDESKKIFHDILLDGGEEYLSYIPNEYQIDKLAISKSIRSRTTISYMTIHHEFEMIFLCENAVDVIRETLLYNDYMVSVEYVNAPKYRIVVQGKTKEECDERIEECFKTLKKKIENKKIIFKIGNQKIIKESEISFKFLSPECVSP
jgi:translation initiation factor 2 alpha subunit (eIF-2alpha)